MVSSEHARVAAKLAGAAAQRRGNSNSLAGGGRGL